jgi:hypothetical protein
VIAPFYLYANIHKPWMCPVHAFAVWWLLASQDNDHLDGYVFRKKMGSDGVSVTPTDAMVCNTPAFFHIAYDD